MIALSPDLDNLVAELAENDHERALMTRAVRLLAFAPTEIEPALDLRDRVLARVTHAERGAQYWAHGDFFAHADDMAWTKLRDGIHVKVLFLDPETHARTTLVRMAPNLPFPPHPHAETEDLYLISGEAWVGDVPMRAGDYCRANPGTAHTDVRSGPMGSLAIVVAR